MGALVVDRLTTMLLPVRCVRRLLLCLLSWALASACRLFSAITDLVEEQDCLVFVLIDEVESLTAARKAAAGGGEPSDAIRAVNALLTQVNEGDDEGVGGGNALRNRRRYVAGNALSSLAAVGLQGHGSKRATPGPACHLRIC